MKNYLPLLIALIFITACDSPRSQRSVISSTQSSSNAVSSANQNTMTPNNGSITDTGSSTGTNSNVVIPEDAKHCKFSTDGVNGFESTSTHLGSYTLCQSSSR